MEHKILVAEDDKGINDAIVIYLKSQGYEPLSAYNGEEALLIAENNDIHLAIIDIMMPVMDGYTLTLKIREKYDFPIIFLSAKSEDIDKITGLNLGADDYMTKPFKSMELLARVHSNLRRYEQILALKEGKSGDNDDLLVVGDLSLDKVRKQIFVGDREVHLTPKELQILELLMSHPGRVFSADQIYETVWQEAAITSETVMVHVRKLREKIEVDPSHPQYIKVVWGIGYKMEEH